MNFRRNLARATVLALGLTSLVTLTGCSSDEPVAEPTPTVEPTPEPIQTPEPDPEPGIVWPLTGVPVTDDELEDFDENPIPALAVKIENAAHARPQMGLEYADVVWEQLVEGGITRYVAVYHSVIPETVLPVRSARPQDVGILAPLQGLFAYSGAQRRFIDMINNAGIQSITMDSGHAGFSRVRDRRAPSNVIGDMQVFLSQARDDRLAPPPAQFIFAPLGVDSSALTYGEVITDLDVRMSGGQRVTWEWDDETGTFLLSNNGTPAMSYAGVRLDAHNVVVLEVQITNRFQVPETVMENTGGRALVLSNGRMIEGTWSKGELNERLVVIDDEGNEMLLAPGRTWVNLMPESQGWTINPSASTD